MFGEEWGAEAGAYSNTVPDTDTITILLYPIPYNGHDRARGIVGFFWGKDNYLRSEIDYSNERVMFYIDSETFAEPEDLTAGRSPTSGRARSSPRSGTSCST